MEWSRDGEGSEEEEEEEVWVEPGEVPASSCFLERLRIERGDLPCCLRPSVGYGLGRAWLAGVVSGRG